MSGGVTFAGERAALVVAGVVQSVRRGCLGSRGNRSVGMRVREWTSFLPLVVLLVAGGGQAWAETGDSVVLQWNDVTLQAIKDTHPGPPICARELAIVSTCVYDAWAA